MFKSFSNKFFLIYSIVISILFILIFIVLTNVFNIYYDEYLKQDLINQGYLIAENYLSASNQLDFENTFRIVNKYNDTRSFLVDRDWIILFDSDSDNDDTLLKGQKLDHNLVQRALNGEVVKEICKINNIFDYYVITVAVPIIKDNDIYGAVVMTTPYPKIKDSISHIYRMTFIGLLTILGLTFLSTYIFSKKTTKMLEAFNITSKKIANGDFSSRINIPYTDGDFGVLAKNMNYMARELEKLEDMRRDFLANTSHDFRSPLTSIKGFVQAILDGTIAPDNQDKYLNIVLDETERLTNLTNNILLLTKMEHSGIAPEKSNFDIHQVIRKVFLQFDQQIVDKNISITLHINKKGLIVNGDLNQIQRVLHNIIDNAVKFCKEQGEIIVETNVIKDKAHISISDTGPGISEDNLKHIWTRFHKVDSSRGRHKRGIGLGLSIVREIIKAHGEHLDVYSQLGKGTTFTFTLALGEKYENV